MENVCARSGINYEEVLARACCNRNTNQIRVDRNREFSGNVDCFRLRITSRVYANEQKTQ